MFRVLNKELFKSIQLHNKTIFYGLFTVFGKLFWDLFHYEISTKIWEMWEKTIFDQI